MITLRTTDYFQIDELTTEAELRKNLKKTFCKTRSVYLNNNR